MSSKISLPCFPHNLPHTIGKSGTATLVTKKRISWYGVRTNFKKFISWTENRNPFLNLSTFEIFNCFLQLLKVFTITYYGRNFLVTHDNVGMILLVGTEEVFCITWNKNNVLLEIYFGMNRK